MMRPDGQGTDERITQLDKKQRKSVNSLERDMFKVALIFTVIAIVVWTAVYLSKRSYEPNQIEGADGTTQQMP